MASEKQQAFLSRTRHALCDDFIKGVINSTHPFTKSWKPGEFKAAYNPISGKRYRGVNAINLAGAGYRDPRWLTFNQGKEKNYRLRKGSKSMPVVFWTLQRRLLQKDEVGRAVLDAHGEKQYVDVQLQSPVCQVYRVFNARDFEGIEPIAAVENDETTQAFVDKGLADVKARIERAGAVIRHDQDNRCFYLPSRDEIHMVPASQFNSEAAYVASLFHEMGHWTGHAARLNRDLSNPFGSQGYAREELRAEFFSFFANIEYGIGFDIRSHQAYLKSWVKILQNDPDELFRAARDADRIAAYLHQLTSEATQDMNTDNTVVEGPVASADSPTKQYMAVSFQEKDDFKSVCIQHNIRYGWDKEAKAWYVEHEPGADLGMFRRWALQGHTLPAPASVSHESIMADFAAVLEEAGLILSGVPVMDGNVQRVPVDGAKPGRKDGAYVGYLDGVANGWYQNYREDIKGKWISNREVGTVVTVAEKARLAQKKLERDNERQQRRDKALKELSEALDDYSGILNDHPYAVRKGLTVSPNTDSELRINKMGSLVIPLYNTDGLLQSAQWIANDGDKGIYKDTVKTGAFAVTSGGGRVSRITTTPEYCTGSPQDIVVLAEGWATAKTIAEHIRQPVIFAVDSANLVAVAAAWRAKWPKANILICADSDSERSQNKGQIYGEKAANAVDGKVLFPPFPKGIRGTDYNDLQVEMLRQGHDWVVINNLIEKQVYSAMAKLKIRTLRSQKVAECALT